MQGVRGSSPRSSTTRDETAKPHPSPARRGVIPSPRTTVTEPLRRDPNPDRALRPDGHRAALAGALGGARPPRDGPGGRRPTQVLPVDDVPVPVGRPAHRPLVHRDAERRAGALPADARLQRLLPDRLRCLRAAGRERRDQERRPPVHLDDGQHREHAAPVPDDGRHLRLEHRGRHRGPVLLPLEPVALPALPGGRPRLPRDVARSTGVPTTGRSPASRSRAPTVIAGGAARRSRSATWSSGSCARPTTPTSCWTSPASTGPSRSRVMQTNWIGRSEGAEIDFEVAPRGVRRAPTSPAATAARLHHPTRHAVRGDLHGPGPRASAGRTS